jgi:hypothetical protein
MGAIKGEGITNQLGRPSLDRLTVLVREAAQNSWDAADPSREGPVEFGLDLTTLSPRSTGHWRDLLANGAPPSSQLPLSAFLDQESLTVLFVSDRGTKGLDGPTRADDASQDESHDYVSFVLNVGEPRDTELGGGTYGYGKAVFFSVSAARAILVHTHCLVDGEVEARLIGCAVGRSFEVDGRSYTGRHWFGLVDDEQAVVEPILGAEADRLAEQLGFPPIGDHVLGTTIAVMAPDFEGHDPVDASRAIAGAIAWHLWPKMIDGPGAQPAMSFRVSVDGVATDVPDPSTHPVLSEFVHAFRELEQGQTISYGVGAMPVGRLRLRTTFTPPPDVDRIGAAAGVGPTLHHCCLLRGPELVVEYRPGPPLPIEHVWYVGVFKTLDDLDETFARAEPPTHDAWSPDYLDDRERSIVRVTLRKIDDAMRLHAAPRPGATPSAGGEGLAAFSRVLGNLVAGAPGQAAGPGGGQPPAGGSKKRARIVLDGDPKWGDFEGRPILIQAFRIEASRPTTIDVQASVKLWGGGGNESDPPLGGSAPVPVGWRGPEGQLHGPGAIAIQPHESGDWVALVDAPTDTVTQIRIREAKDD